MKHILWLFLALISVPIYAQEEMVVSVDAKNVAKSEVPPAVIDALKNDFPSMEAMKYYLFPSGKIDSDWAVAEDDRLDPGESVNVYNVLIKGDKGGYVNALYDKNGELMSMKVLAVDYALPENIRTAATSGKYEGYTIKGNKFVRVVNKKKNTQYTEVIIEKGGSTKKLYFDADGNLTKEK